MPRPIGVKVEKVSLGAVLLIACLMTGWAQPAQPEAPAIQSDMSAVERLIQSYFQARSSGDLALFDRCWSRTSTERCWHRRSLELDKLRNQIQRFDRVSVTDVSKAGTRANATVQVSQPDRGGRGETLGGNTTFEVTAVKEQGQWRIRDVNSDADRRAGALRTAPQSDAERLNGPMNLALGVALLRIAERLETRSDGNAAIRAASLACEAFEGTNQLRLGDALLVTASARLTVSQTEQAAKDVDRALSIFRDGNDLAGLARAHWMKGRVDAALGRLESALEDFDRAAAIAEPNGDSTFARVLVSRAGPEIDKGQFKPALSHLMRALSLTTALGDETYRARALHNLGDLYIEQREFDLALTRLTQALNLKRRLLDNAGAGKTLNSIAIVYIYQGRCPLARTLLQAGLQAAQAAKDPIGEGYILNQLGTCYNIAGQPQRAIELHEQALAASKGDGKASGDDSLMGAVLTNLAEESRLLRRYDDALRYARESIETVERTRDRGVLWQAQTTVGNTHLDRGERSEARKSLETAIETVEALRADAAGTEQSDQSFFADKLLPYHLMMRSYLEDRDTLAGLRYAERSKARLLLDILQGGRVEINHTMTAAERSAQARLKERLGTLNGELLTARQAEKLDAALVSRLERQLEDARREAEEFRTRLFAEHPGLKAKRGEVTWTGPASLRKIVREGVALLEYVVTENETELFVFTQPVANQHDPNVKVYRLPVGSKTLTAQVKALRGQIAGRERSFTTSAQALYGRLIAPAAQDLAGKNLLVIAPDGPLWELPFQALLHNGRFLWEDAALLFTPSMAVVQHGLQLPDRQTGPRTLLAFGNPKLDAQTEQAAAEPLRGAHLGDLPHAEQEVRNLEKVYGTANSRIYTGPNALESRWKSEAPRFGILHIAAHGVRDDARPLYSFMALARSGPKDPEDGLLEASEIMQLALQADLAVLSGCETAGEARDGEGMVGLAWAFFVAGTPTTVASQWSVQSQATSELMTAFHGALVRSWGGPDAAFSVARALREAALPMLRAGKHPFEWAAFVTIASRL